MPDGVRRHKLITLPPWSTEPSVACYLHACHHLLQLSLLLIQHCERGPRRSISWQLWWRAFTALGQLAAQPVGELRSVQLELQHGQDETYQLC